MSPIFTKEVTYSVDASDLAYLINNLYGQDPEIEASCEMGHDDIVEIGADSGEYDDDDKFKKWLNKREYQRSEIRMLMHKLAFDGHIEDGTYLIKTC